MKILVMADGSVGERLVGWLLQYYREDLACVVTNSENAIFKTACSAGIPCHVYKNEESLLAFWCSLNQVADYGLLLWWPHIVQPATLKLVSNGFINTHPSLLPYNRGKHYNFWAIVEEAPFGVSLHFVHTGIDRGDIIAQQRIFYDWEDNGGSLYHKAQASICELFEKTFPLVRSGQYQRRQQNLKEGSFHWSRELEPASRIDLNKTYTGRQLLNLLRARTFEGKPACRFSESGSEYEVRVQIKKTQ